MIFRQLHRMTPNGHLIIRSDYFTGHRFQRKQNGLRYTVATCPCYCFIGPVLTPEKQDFIFADGLEVF